jgi:hypothetical protein
MTALNYLLSGAIVTAAIVIALFFLRFWKQTRDSFFLYFSAAFVLEAVHRLLSAFNPLHDEEAALYYLLRLSSYSLILLAIIRKNRRPPQ